MPAEHAALCVACNGRTVYAIGGNCPPVRAEPCKAIGLARSSSSRARRGRARAVSAREADVSLLSACAAPPPAVAARAPAGGCARVWGVSGRCRWRMVLLESEQVGRLWPRSCCGPRERGREERKEGGSVERLLRVPGCAGPAP